MRVTLQAHPATPCQALNRIEVEVARPEGGRLDLRFTAFGDIERLRLPEPATPAHTDELWKHTCFEAFLQPAAGPAYLEFNLSPSTQWAAYAFDAERTGMRNLVLPPPRIETAFDPEQFELWTSLDLDLPAETPWRLGLTAVIEEVDGTSSYWALAHPGARPDFHHPGGFTLDLTATA